MGRLAADFCGEVALVTGAAGGIGRALVRALAEAGARVHALDRELPPEGSLELAAGAPAPTWHACDLCSTAEVEALVERVAQSEGRLDHLVNNAGVTRDAVLWKTDDESWQHVLDVNLGGAFRVLRAAVPHMRRQGRGAVVQVASINGLRGRFGQASYSASKAGLIALTRTAARELGAFGVRVNALAPGLIETPMTAGLPDEVRARALAETTLGRLGRPEDVARAALFLLSEDAAHLSGVVLPVDGGQLA